MRRINVAGLFLATVLLTPYAEAQAGSRKLEAAVVKLTKERDSNPSSAAANRALGIALYKLERYAQSRPLLDQARKLEPTDGVSALYAGLAAEQMKDFTAAKAAYNEYLGNGKTAKIRNDIRARLVLLTKQEMKVAAQDAVRNEARIAQAAGPANTIAVMPLKFSGTDATLQPLERGLADLIINDLAKSSKVTVVERDRMQAIADEIALGASGAADKTTAVRAGKIIQAGSIVQGAITQLGANNVSLDATVLSTATSEAVGNQSSQPGLLDQIFAIEKRVVFDIFNALKIDLTAAERLAIDARPTSNLQAFLAYSRGLQAEDQGKFDDAARFFESARSIDPSFSAASNKSATANVVVQAQAVTMVKVESNIRSSSSEGAVVQAAEKGQTVNTAPATTGTTGTTGATGEQKKDEKAAPAVVVSSTGSSGTSGSLGQTLNSAAGDVNPTTTNTVATTTTTTTSSAPAPETRNPTSEKTGTDSPAPRTGNVVIVIRKP